MQESNVECMQHIFKAICEMQISFYVGGFMWISAIKGSPSGDLLGDKYY